ncbi:uroporphyrinogen-III C-methyltransferase [Chitinophaga sp. GCM10012297]|uniref:uroporphyrinogen-III C-methyltransferase n=1 Tax=Chitinophaga chungangae TaxID=2821488 RepID=A0ABS3Y9S7_9BACT|nr:uroporphyrinogen-III C-methyltransferase [Chitinophaga chungangae]MBO9151240.1 uroporphyrinogen-III C-methyltransferase [Chitinophaga chungangae]
MPEAALTLIGAGPGDPEMITLKAIRALGSADVVLYDALVNPQLLEYAPKQAVCQFVGKRFGCHSLSQDEINELIISSAKQYGHVVRLKGGDPFVFGRAVEEIEAASRAGIRVKVVPGISSALSVPAMQMIPLTSRGVAESFWVTTGTTRSGDISGDVYLAARSTATVVILMAMSRIGAIMDIFKEAGKTNVPVAVIQNGTTDQEKILTGKVSGIAAEAEAQGVGNPAVIVIGEVVKWREQLAGIVASAQGHYIYEER